MPTSLLERAKQRSQGAPPQAGTSSLLDRARQRAESGESTAGGGLLERAKAKSQAAPILSAAPSRRELAATQPPKPPLFPRPGEDPIEAAEREQYLSTLATETPEAEIGEGISAFRRGEYAKGGARTLGGLMRGVAPAALGYAGVSAMAAPWATAAEFGGGTALDYGVRKGAEALGASPEQAELAGMASGVIPIMGSVRRGMQALKRESPLSVVPREPGPAPTIQLETPPPPPSPVIEVPTGPASPRPRGPELSSPAPVPTGSAPMEFSEARQRLNDIDTTLAQAGQRRLTQIQQEKLRIEKAGLERYLSNEQMGLPFTDPNELRPAIPPSPVPEWQVPEGGYQPPRPYGSILKGELRAAEGVAPSVHSGQSTLWGEHFPSVEKVKEVTEALEGGSTAARQFLESLNPEEREAFLTAAREIAEAEARTAEIGGVDVEAPQMLGATPPQTGQMTMPFGDLAASEVGRPQMGRVPVGPDLTARIEQAAQLAGRLKEFEPHQQSVMWGSKVEDFRPERPVYGALEPPPSPPGTTPVERYPVRRDPNAPAGFEQPQAAVHQMDVETAKKTYPALRRLADQINRREAELNKQRQRIDEARRLEGSANYNPAKVEALEDQYRRIQSKGPSLEESPQILETVQRMEREIGLENLETYTPDIPPTPPMRGGRGGGRGGPEPPESGRPGAPPPPRGVPEDLEAPPASTYVQARTQLEDSLYPIKHMEKAASEELPVESSPYKMARLFAGAFGKAEAKLEALREKLAPIRQTLGEDIKGLTLFGTREGKPSQLVQDFERHALNNHLMDVMQERPEYRAPGNRTREQIIQEQRELEQTLGPEKLARVREAEQAIYEHSQAQLNEMVEAGLFDAETATVLKQLYPRYVPLNRIAKVFEDVENWRPGGRSMSVKRQDIIRKLTEQGSEAEVVRPLESLTRKTFETTILAERNKVSRAMYDLADRPEFQGSVIRMRADQKAPPGMQKMSVLIDGDKYDYAVPQAVGEAMSGMTKAQMDIMTRMASISGAALRSGATTMNLAFVPANMVRDYYTATMRSPVGFTPLDYVAGVMAAVKGGKSQAFREYMESGAALSGFFEQHNAPKAGARSLVESEASRVGKVVLNPFQLMRQIAEISELGTRVGLHRRAKMAGMSQGMSQGEAAMIGRDTTIDFSKSGTSMRLLNLWTPFLNARTQGSLNMARTFRDNPADAALTATALVGLPVLATYLHNTRNFAEIDRDIAEWEKENYFYLIYGDERDPEGNPTQVVKIPKEDVGRVVGNQLLNALQWMDQQSPDDLNQLAASMDLLGEPLEPGQGTPSKDAGTMALNTIGDISPIDIAPQGQLDLGAAVGMALPPMARVAAENTLNTKFWNRQPVTRNPDASPQNQFSERTAPRAIAIGQFFGISPDKLENFIVGQFGGIGRQILDPTQFGKQTLGRFFGVRGGGVEARRYEQGKQFEQQYADERVQGTVPARRLFMEAQKLPEQERMAYLGEKVQDLDAANTFELFDLISKSQGGLTRFEESMRYDPVGARAAKMLKEIEAAGDGNEQELAEMMSRWAQNGLLTRETVEMMTQIQGAKMAGEAPVLRPAKPKR